MDSNAKIIPLHLHPLGFIECFTQLGASLDALLQHTGITPHMIANPIGRISYAQQVRLLRNGVSACRVPGLGLQVGMQWDWSFHGTVGYIIHSSPSLQEAAAAFRRYQMVAQPFYRVSAARPLGYMDENDRYVFPLRCFPAPDADAELLMFEMEFRLATTLRLWEACGNRKVADPSVHVELAYPEPPHRALYQTLPCASIRFDAPASHVAAHKSFRSQPFRPHRRAIYDRLIAQCEEDLRMAGLHTTTSEAVRMHIAAHFSRQFQMIGEVSSSHRPVSLNDTSQALRTTPRTLVRKLAAENTSFRKLLHESRIEMTLYQLKASRLDAEDIAELTGFSSASSMRRAIRSAAGLPLSKTRSPGPSRPAAV